MNVHSTAKPISRTPRVRSGMRIRQQASGTDAAVEDSYGPTPRGGTLSKQAWLALAMLTLCSFGLTHNFDTPFGTREVTSTEAGRGVEEEQRFAKDVKAAPIQRQLGFLGVIVLTAYCAIGFPRGVRVESPLVVALCLVMLAWAVLSVAWSTAPGETVRELIRIVVYLLAGLSIARRFPINEVCLLLVLCLAFSVSFATCVDVVTPGFTPWKSDFRLHGTLHANDLARQALLLAIAAYAYARKFSGVNIWWLVLALALGILFLTKSRTALVTVVFGLASVRLLALPGKSLFGSLLTGVALVGFVLMSVSCMDSATERWVMRALAMGRQEGVTSLTGRLPLWHEVWMQAREKAMFGFGYGAFWTIERTQDMGEELLWFPRHAHSVYVETIVNLGFIGLTMLLALTFVLFGRALSAFHSQKRLEYLIFASTIFIAMVNGISEAAFVLPRDQGLFNSIVLFSLVFVHPTKSDDEKAFRIPSRTRNRRDIQNHVGVAN